MPRCLSSSPSAITNGVFPLPPTEMFPMLTTGRASFCTLKTPRSYSTLLSATPAPKMAETGFIGHLALAAQGVGRALPASCAWLQHASQKGLWPDRPAACVLVDRKSV